MPGEEAGALVTVRYWAGARAAAGVDEDVLENCATVTHAAAAVIGLHPDLASILPVSTLLLDGRAVGLAAPLSAGAVLEVLPPFAGG